MVAFFTYTFRRESECDDPRVSLLSQDLFLSEDSEEEPQDQLSAEVSPLKDFKRDILTDGIVYETAPYSGSVTKYPSSSLFQTSVPAPSEDAPSDRLQDVVSTISKKERPLGELTKNKVLSCLFLDESLSSYADAACERNANLSNVGAVATLGKGRECQDVVNSVSPPLKNRCDLTLNAFTTRRHDIDELRLRNRLDSKPGQSNLSRVAKAVSADTAMFTRKRRESSLSVLTFQCKHTPFLYDSDSEDTRNRISKQIRKFNNGKELCMTYV